MTDLSTMLFCITLLVILFKVLSFLKWYFKNETYLCDRLEEASAQRDEYRFENERLLKELDRLKNPLSDIYE